MGQGKIAILFVPVRGHKVQKCFAAVAVLPEKIFHRNMSAIYLVQNATAKGQKY